WRWLGSLPLARMYLLTPRPSVPPPTAKKVGGGRVDFCWLVLDVQHRGPPTWGWLHRDRAPVQVQTQAISQRVPIAILRESLEALLPEPLVRVHEREARQRRALRKRIETSCARSPTPRGQRRKRKVEATQPGSQT